MQTLDSLDNFAAHLVSCNRPGDAMVLRSYINELRPYFEPSDSPCEQGTPEMSAHFRAWSAICEVMREVRGPDWSQAQPVGTVCPRDAAVTAIRSMAAQCSAQPVAGRPTGVPPLRQAQIGALSYAIGYLEARDRGAVALELSTLHAWLVANAPQE